MRVRRPNTPTIKAGAINMTQPKTKVAVMGAGGRMGRM